LKTKVPEAVVQLELTYPVLTAAVALEISIDD